MPIGIINVYSPPVAAHNNLTLDNYNSNRDLILVGDFNCHNILWGNPKTEQQCYMFEDFINNNLVCKRKEGNVLFNDALNTFYLRLYGVRHIVKYHTKRERGNPLPAHGLLFPINSKGSFICTILQTGLHIPRPLLHQSLSTGWNEK